MVNLFPLIFFFKFIAHHVVDGFADIFSFIDDLVNGLCNRHVDIQFLGQLVGDFGRRDPFNDHAHVGFDVFQFFATSESIPSSPVTGVNRSSGNDQVTDPRQTAIGQWASSELNAKARDFSETARDDGCFGIVTITKTVQGPSSDSDDILQGSSSFHSDDICIGIQAEVVIAKEFLNIACSL